MNLGFEYLTASIRTLSEYQEKMEYKGSFYMDLCAEGKQYYVGIMEYQEDGTFRTYRREYC